MTNELHFLYKRDLLQLRREVEAYQVESNLWRLENQIKNTAGNLALHLCGNLQHFIGHVLGGTDYIRDREFEFAAKDIPRENILKEIDNTLSMIDDVIPNLDESKFSESFPIQVFKEHYNTFQMVIHLQGHLNYHLGQVNYHRRIFESN